MLNWRAPPRAMQHFDAPRVFTIENFGPAEACAWIVAQSAKSQRAAPVMDRAAQAATLDVARTNTSCYFDRLGHELILHLVDLRIAALSGLHVIHQEPTNVLRYQPGQEYKPHYDFFAGADEAAFAAEIARIGQRIGTVLIYLNDDYAGGETASPHLDWRFKGKTGDALLFWSANAQGQLERNALHASLPVTSGEKWLLSNGCAPSLCRSMGAKRLTRPVLAIEIILRKPHAHARLRWRRIGQHDAIGGRAHRFHQSALARAQAIGRAKS